MTTCDCILEIGDWPFHPHGRPDGMLGGFVERDMNMGDGVKHYTSLADLRRDERAHGLEPLERHDLDRIPSRQEQSRKLLEERQRATEPARLRAIGEALKRARRS